MKTETLEEYQERIDKINKSWEMDISRPMRPYRQTFWDLAWGTQVKKEKISKGQNGL